MAKLLAEAGASLATGRIGMDCVELACERATPKCLALLLACCEEGRALQGSLLAKVCGSALSTSEAARIECVRILLDAGAPIEGRSELQCMGPAMLTPLMLAACLGQCELSSVLLDAGADLSAKDGSASAFDLASAFHSEEWIAFANAWQERAALRQATPSPDSAKRASRL